jgi:hypothetical protein
LRAGVDAARHPWLLVLHADTVLQDGWTRDVKAFMERIDTGQGPPAAAVFRFALDDVGAMPRLVEAGVALRCTLFGLPYGDQGLLIPARLYRERGGYKPLPLMEDVDLIRRLKRSEKVMLRATALTSAERYKRDGYVKRIARNLTCLSLYAVGVPVTTIQRIYLKVPLKPKVTNA